MSVSLDRLRALELPPLWKQLADAGVRPTLLLRSAAVDEATGAQVVLVSETFQETGSFKFRAALCVAQHREAPHLLTASSGNFGAALALACKRVGKRCTVVMPAVSAAVKIAAVRRHGAQVELVDTTRTTRAARLAELAQTDVSTRTVSPYDDVHVIAGNASLGAELFARLQPDCVVVPVGGGGLSSGFVVARDTLGARSEIIGAEPHLANDAARSLRTGTRVANAAEPPTLCDGARTLMLGELNFEVLKEGLAGIEEAEEETVVRAVRLLFDAHLKAEPTGALALAAMLSRPERFAGKQVACVVSGGNVDAAVYARCLQSSG